MTSQLTLIEALDSERDIMLTILLVIHLQSSIPGFSFAKCLYKFEDNI